MHGKSTLSYKNRRLSVNKSDTYIVEIEKNVSSQNDDYNHRNSRSCDEKSQP